MHTHDPPTWSGMARVKRRPQLFWPLMLMLMLVGVKSILIALTHVAAMPSLASWLVRWDPLAAPSRTHLSRVSTAGCVMNV